MTDTTKELAEALRKFLRMSFLDFDQGANEAIVSLDGIQDLNAALKAYDAAPAPSDAVETEADIAHAKGFSDGWYMAIAEGMRQAAEIVRQQCVMCNGSGFHPGNYTCTSSVCASADAILAAIPAAGAWEPPADQRPGEYTLAPHLQKLIENVIRQDGRMSKALRQQLAAYVSPPPAPAGEGEP